MENNNSHLPPQGSRSQLINPIFLVLSGSEIKHRSQMIKRFFHNMNSKYMAAYFYEDIPISTGCDDFISIPINLDSKHLHIFISELDTAIRKNKLSKYPNNNDLTVCLFFDSANSINSLVDVCENLYNLLSNAYYNHVFFDIYFLLLEDFFPDSAITEKNIEAAKQLAKVNELEFVRYIFLLSDVSGQGQLTTDSDKLFQMVLLSIFLTNCSVDGMKMGQLQNTLMSEAENSKFFCLGQTSLNQSKQDIKQMIQTELLKQLSLNIQFNENLSINPACLGALQIDVHNEIMRQCQSINSIGCYSYDIPVTTTALSNLDCLNVFFHDNHSLYMDAVEIRCRQHFSVQIVNYWRQIKAWLDDLLYQYNASICVPKCEQFVVSIAENAIDRLRLQFQAESDSVRKRLVAWKNQEVQIKRKKRSVAPERFVYQLLKQWYILKAEEIKYQILTECVLDIRIRIRFWQENVVRKCNIFFEIQKNADCDWKALLQNSTSTNKLLLQYRRNALSAYLKQNPRCIDDCLHQLNAMLEKQAGIDEIFNLISAHAEQLFWEGMKNNFLWASPCLIDILDDPRTKDLYEELYHALKNDIPLNTRRYISDMVSYLCFFGGSQDKFINYIRQQDEFQCVLYFEDCSVPLEAFYFQHLSSSATFFWKEIMRMGDCDS